MVSLISTARNGPATAFARLTELAVELASDYAIDVLRV